MNSYYEHTAELCRKDSQLTCPFPFLIPHPWRVQTSSRHN